MRLRTRQPLKNAAEFHPSQVLRRQTKIKVQDTPWEKGLDEQLRFSAGTPGGLLPKTTGKPEVMGPHQNHTLALVNSIPDRINETSSHSICLVNGVSLL